MTEEMIFRLVLTIAGVVEMAAALFMLAEKKLTETICMFWVVSAMLSIISGILLPLAEWTGGWDIRVLALVALAGGVLLFIAFLISMRLSASIRSRERSLMEAALLRFEKEYGAGRDLVHKELLVILPAYNEEKSLPGFLLKLEEAGIGEIADLLVLDDGSTDRMCQLVREMGRHCVNCAHLGYGRTLQTGYIYASRAGYRFVIQMDADGQHDPCNVRNLYQALQGPGQDGRPPDIVLGSRFLPGGETFPMSRAKLLMIRLFRLILRLLTGREITDPTTGLQGLNARAAACFAREENFDGQYPDANMILQMQLRGYYIQEIPAVMHARTAGRGMYSGLRPVIYVFHMLLSIFAVYIREALLPRRPKDEDHGP